MGKIDYPNCDICDKIKDVYHTLVEYNRIETKGNEVIAKLKIENKFV